MKKINSITLFLVVFAFALTGCTVMPASEETGIGPKEFAEMRNAENLKRENEVLKSELENIKTEMQKIEKNYLELEKNNNFALSKLEEAEIKLEFLESEGIPKFISEKTDKNSIVTYLKNSKDILEDRLKGIEVVSSIHEGNVLFYTTGYGESFNQLFIWKEGENEPNLIDGATFEKNGTLNWINNKFLELNTGNNEYKIIDTDNIEIRSAFNSKHDVYLLPETSTYILKNQEGLFVFYDFIKFTEQEINLDYKNKYTEFNVSNDNLVFNGAYTDEYETQYSVKAIVKIDDIKDKYNIVTLEKAIESMENINEEKTEIIESTDEGKSNEI